ncbi:Phospholipase C [Lachnellula willkommii]|uniref:Phospholipase C n=1 Tax=Lachnellula willkommii TaxID=215461 RepID=A0A559MEL4_9HELO|nr:Phospholipase C [Lachnellula willkommii]
MIPILIFIYAAIVSAGSLKDIQHVVLFMQENRAFDHYFGTMAGVRGFSDPNVQVNADGKNTFQQKVPPDISTEAETLLPYYINYLGGNWTESTQCTGAGQNSFQNNQACLNNDLNNLWAVNNTPTSWAHFRRQDVPVQFSIAEAWTVADMYQEGVIAATEPNRVTWMTGSVNCPGGPQTPDQGGAVLDNNGTPGGVITPRGELTDKSKGVRLLGLHVSRSAGRQFLSFIKMLDWIVGPAELSEHVPYLPRDGAWLQKKVVDAVVHGAAYNSTVVMISYDETGGWGDHVTPFHSSPGTPGEWLDVDNDVFGYLGQTYTGPGMFEFLASTCSIADLSRLSRSFLHYLPLDTRRQCLHRDGRSQFPDNLQQWLEALGYNGTATDQMPAWRRQHMSTLLNAFDFDHVTRLLDTQPRRSHNPLRRRGWQLGRRLHLPSKYGNPPPKPPAPFGPENENSDPSKLSEQGFKPVRGYLTEGRYLVFEMNGYAVTAGPNATQITGTEATSDHRGKNQRWVVHASAGTATDGGQGSGTFVLSSAADGRFLADHTSLAKDRSGAETYTIADMGNGKGYSLMKEDGKYLSINTNGTIDIVSGGAEGFQVFSVTYQS